MTDTTSRLFKPTTDANLLAIRKTFSRFRTFAAYVWKHLGLQMDQTQLEMCDWLQDGPERCMVQAWRGEGKSWITAAYVVWLLLMEPRLQVLVESANEDRAGKFTYFCRQLIEDIEILRHLRPRPHQRQSTLGFDVGPAELAQQESLKALGIFGQMTGSRADVIIPDDIEVPNTAETVKMRDKLDERVREFDAVLKPGGLVRALGTPQCEDTVYSKMEQRGYVIRIWPAEYPQEKHLALYGDRLAPRIADAVKVQPTLAGVPVEPVRFGVDELAKRKLSYGPAGYAMQFLLLPSLADLEQYPLKLKDLLVTPLSLTDGPESLVWTATEDRLDNDLPNVGLSGDRLYKAFQKPGTQFVPYQMKIMTIDPSGRGKDETGYAIGASLHGMIFLLDAGGVGGIEESDLDHLIDRANVYGVQQIKVEPNYGGGTFAVALRGRIKTLGLEIAVDDAEWSRGQKEKRIIETLLPIVGAHRLVVDRDLFDRDYRSVEGREISIDQKVRYRLWHQYTRITPIKGSLVHDDRLEAVAMLVAELRDVVQRDVAGEAERTRREDYRKEVDQWLSKVPFGRDTGKKRGFFR